MQAWESGAIEQLDDHLARLEASDPRELALARELALGAVRWARLYDHLAAAFLDRPVDVQPPPLLTALRLASHQLFALDRIPPHAVVDETVRMLHAVGHGRLSGVANAVSRKLAGIRLEDRLGDGPLGRIPPDRVPGDPGLRASLPELLVQDLRPVLPTGEVRDYDRLNLVPHLCTRTRPGAPAPVGASVLRREGPWTWWDDPREALRHVDAGICVVQDRSQGATVELARARPGELVLDLCAAPGGKSLGLQDAGCRVVAADAGLGKARGLHRLDLPTLVADGRRPALAAGFDLVLVDAPCSNSGVLGRRPEARWRYTRGSLASLEALQQRLLRAASTLVAPGGRLVYSTCSLSPRENQAIAHRLDGWRILAEHATWPDAWGGGAYGALLVRR